MPTQSPVLDPRSIVTPDAFEVSSALLGMPLATPGRRLLAILADLAVIGTITVLTTSFALVLGVVVAALFIRLSLQRTPVRGSVFHRAMRLSLGCLGLVVGVVTAIVWAAVGFDFGGPDGLRVPVAVTGSDGAAYGERDLALSDLAGFLGGGLGLLRAEDEPSARQAMEALVRRGRAVGSSDASIRASILEMVPPERPWADEAGTILDSVFAGTPDVAMAPDSLVAAGTAPAPSLAAALEEYAVLLRTDPEAAENSPAGRRRNALRDRLRDELAGDTLTVLENEVEQLGDIAAARLESMEELELALEEAAAGDGIFAWLRGFLDELGFGFGWASLYLTVVLSWWQGQTVGKKLLGIRVVRLDGGPITWWVAFERAGGYAAGFATGLLGFAQVWWDANRQAIHDRIVGTVVVIDGAEPVDDAW